MGSRRDILDIGTADTPLQIVTVRAPMSAYDRLLKDWRSRGGDAIRREFEETSRRRDRRGDYATVIR